MDIKKFLSSKIFKYVLIGVGFFVIALLIFQAGKMVGYRKAAFSYGWGDNYFRAFEGRQPQPMFMKGVPMMGREDFPEAHGAAGKILSVNLPTFVIQGPDKIEKVVLIKDDTKIMRFKEEINPEDIKVDDSAVIIGSPNDESQVEAKLIRIMPAVSGVKN